MGDIATSSWKLYSSVAVLIFVGILAGVSVLTMDKFSTAARENAPYYYDNVTLNVAASPSDNQATLTHDNVVRINSCQNASENGVQFTVGSTCNLTNPNSNDAGVIQVANTSDGVATAHIIRN